MRLFIRSVILFFFLALTFNVIGKTNSESIKRTHPSKAVKNKFCKIVTPNDINYLSRSTIAKTKILSKNNISFLNKTNQITANNVLDSTVYLQENVKRKYEVDFNSNNLISLELIYYWDDLSNSWISDTRNSRQYNSDNKQTEELSEYYNRNTAAWISDWKYTAEYSNAGNSELWLFNLWNTQNNGWDAIWRQTIEKSNNLVKYYEEIWDDSLSTWRNDYQSEINYDDSGNELNYFGESWDINLGSWVNSWKDTTFYDDQSRMIGYKSYYWESDNWFAWDNEVYSYNDNGTLAELLVLDFDYSSMAWLNYQLISFSYDANNQLTQRFINNLDVNYYNYRTTFEYDENGNMKYAMNEEVHPIDGSATLVTNKINFSDIFANYSFNASELNAFYSMPTRINISTELVKNEFVLEQNYPNPFNPSTIINYTIPNELRHSEPTVLKVFDILGNEIITLVREYQSAGSYNIEFNARNLTSGVYFYRLTVGDFEITKSMLLLK